MRDVPYIVVQGCNASSSWVEIGSTQNLATIIDYIHVHQEFIRLFWVEAFEAPQLEVHRLLVKRQLQSTLPDGLQGRVRPTPHTYLLPLDMPQLEKQIRVTELRQRCMHIDRHVAAQRVPLSDQRLGGGLRRHEAAALGVECRHHDMRVDHHTIVVLQQHTAYEQAPLVITPFLCRGTRELLGYGHGVVAPWSERH